MEVQNEVHTEHDRQLTANAWKPGSASHSDLWWAAQGSTIRQAFSSLVETITLLLRVVLVFRTQNRAELFQQPSVSPVQDHVQTLFEMGMVSGWARADRSKRGNLRLNTNYDL